MTIKLPPDFKLDIIPHPRPSDEFLSRLIAFYHRQPSPELSQLWKDVLRLFQQRLHDALTTKNTTLLGDILCSMYATDLVWGLDDWNNRADAERPWPKACTLLANAIGIGRLENPEQPGNDEMGLKHVLSRIDAHFGCKVGRVGGGGMMGFADDGRWIPRKFLESLTTLTSIMRLPNWPPIKVVELGAGLGFLGSALFMTIPRLVYNTVDLPTVSVLQAYLLSQCVGENAIWLDGEARKETDRVFICGPKMPNLVLGADLVINQDSLPEMTHVTQDAYLSRIADCLCADGFFLSVNHEGIAGNQRSVHLAMQNVKGMKLVSRHPYWGRSGYVEEVYARQADKGA